MTEKAWKVYDIVTLALVSALWIALMAILADVWGWV